MDDEDGEYKFECPKCKEKVEEIYFHRIGVCTCQEVKLASDGDTVYCDPEISGEADREYYACSACGYETEDYTEFKRVLEPYEEEEEDEIE